MAIQRDHRNDEKKPSPPRPRAGAKPTPATGTSDAIVRDHRATEIQHIFVLMLENRSFDHMLGFSEITGTDTVTGKATAINGLKGTESNTFNGKTFTVQREADNVMPHDPGHEFEDVLAQLCGPGATYKSGGKYPAMNNSGYVATYAKSAGPDNAGEIMKCYTPQQLPVLTQLAKEFVVCDNWYASMPGPTWPNRMFAHAGSSGGLDHSPSTTEIIGWELAPFGGFEFKHGTIFDALNHAHVKYRLYAGDDFPMASALKGISVFDIHDFSERFAKDLNSSKFEPQYVFIEPSYDVLSDYKNGTSQHPLGNVIHGEALIKATYEAIRNSPVWNHSMLIITWDEHGGFYDHANSGNPPQAVAPGDTTPRSEQNQHGFTFDHFGPRVPAVIISPLAPRNLIDHRIYDHSSIPATIARTFKFAERTRRDSFANGVNTLATLKTARSDCPATLHAPAAEAVARVMAPSLVAEHAVTRPAASVNEGNLPAVLHAALRQDLEISPPEQRQAIIDRVQAMHTRAEALEYMKEVQQKVRPKRLAAAA